MPPKRKSWSRPSSTGGSSSRASSSRVSRAKRYQEIEEEQMEEIDSADEVENGAWVRPAARSKNIAADLTVNQSPGEGELDLMEEDDQGLSDNSDGADDGESRFIGSHIPLVEARKRWPYRYQGHLRKDRIKYPEIVNLNNTSNLVIQARRHYVSAMVDGNIVYGVGDDAYVKGEEDGHDYICRIIEMFEAKDHQLYFTAQWYYRAEDTVIMAHKVFVHDKRVFLSELKDDNPLGCLVSKLRILRLPMSMDSCVDEGIIADYDYYCNALYFLPYTSFVNLPIEKEASGNESNSTISSENDAADEVSNGEVNNNGGELALLDLFAGCGAMSTGLCLGANMRGVKLVNKWAVDFNPNACESLKFNHPETQVRHETAEDFLYLLLEWKTLCENFDLIGKDRSEVEYVEPEEDSEEDDSKEDDIKEDDSNEEIFEVDEILAISNGNPNLKGSSGLFYLVKWKGYGPDYDSWEPAEGLIECQESIKKFVVNGYKSKFLPLPGDVDVLCGGPPCQGISGFNRYRNKDRPLDDVKNKQLAVYMDIVEYLKPRFVLMENVVDLLRFSKGYLARYALGRLVGMHYQARMGMMAAGAYGLPQFRNRVFLWAARPNEMLPQYPLPTHDVISRGVIPSEFELSVVAHENINAAQLGRALFIEDALTDLPVVDNKENRDVMPYDKEPLTEFQKFIRLRREEMLGYVNTGVEYEHGLFDHIPLPLNRDDYQRACQIPMKKGANFRNLKGVKINADNKVVLDPAMKRIYLPSGKPLIPDYAMSFTSGSSSKPFGRLWWDETVPTVVTRAEPHNQAILHPAQIRVLTVRENARLQGFPDYYRLFGPIKQRYVQVGNAVAVPVSRALGYAFASSLMGDNNGESLCVLPKNFPCAPEDVPKVEAEDEVPEADAED